MAPDLTRVRERAAEPVVVPWRAALRGFLAGFLLALLPAAYVTHALALAGDTAWAFATVLAVSVGLAAAILRTARVLTP